MTFYLQSNVKSAIFSNLEESKWIVTWKIGQWSFDNNPDSSIKLTDQIKEAVLHIPFQFDEIDASCQLKKFENQTLSCQMELSHRSWANVYQDAESAEFIQKRQWTLLYLNQNIEDIQSINNKNEFMSLDFSSLLFCWIYRNITSTKMQTSHLPTIENLEEKTLQQTKSEATFIPKQKEKKGDVMQSSESARVPPNTIKW